MIMCVRECAEKKNNKNNNNKYVGNLEVGEKSQTHRPRTYFNGHKNDGRRQRLVTLSRTYTTLVNRSQCILLNGRRVDKCVLHNTHEKE